MRDRAGEPAIVHRHRELRHPRHEAVVVRGAAVGSRVIVGVRLLLLDVADGADDRIGKLPRAPLHLVVLRVVEQLAVVDRVPAVLLDLTGAGRVLRQDRHAADRPVDEAHGLLGVLARDQVVALEVLRVLPDVEERRDRAVLLRELLEVDHRQVVVGVRAREAVRRAVVGPARSHRVLLERVEVRRRSRSRAPSRRFFIAAITAFAFWFA